MPVPDNLCDPEDGSVFFDGYLASEDVRKRYTAEEVEVYDAENPSKLLRKVRAAELEPFKIAIYDTRWVRTPETAGASQPQRVEIRQSQQGKQFRVDYVNADYGDDDEVVKRFGRPGANQFEFDNGCWRLTREYL